MKLSEENTIKNIIIIIRGSIEDDNYDVIKEMEHNAETIRENYSGLENISVTVSEEKYPYGLNPLILSDIFYRFLKNCNEEDILSSTEITDEEINNEEFVKTALNYYEGMISDNPDWGYYVVSAIRQTREEMQN